ncbi:hypothetical protein [Pseudomonas syringae]|uniref:hypothetical protein n=1 Tax=Pseudomonas syringae TaxID=317 RepID=UPI0034D66471
MNNISDEEVLGLISELTPKYMHDFLNRAWLEKDFDLDRAGMTLTGEINSSTTIVKTSQINRQNSLWLMVQGEVYDFLCTKSAIYKTERAEAGMSAKNIISIVAAALAGKLHLALGVVIGIVTLAVIGVFKLTKNAWCKLQTESRLSS